MFTRHDILLGIIAPFVISAGLLLVARRSWTWPASVAVGAAMLIAFIARIAWPSLKPADSLGWIWLIALAAIWTGALASSHKIPFWIFALAAFAVAVGSACLLLRPMIPHTGSMGAALMWIGGIGISTAGIGLIGEMPARRSIIAAVPLSLFLIAGASSACLAMSGSLKLGLLGGALTAGLAGIIFACWIRKPAGFHGLMFVFQVLLACLLMYGYFYASLLAWPAGLFFVAPLFIFVPELLKQSGRRALVIRLVGVSLPLAIAGSIVYREHARKMDDPTGYYYGVLTGTANPRFS